MKKIKGALLC